MKILISAYGCEPFKGSEQGVGWNWALGMTRFSDIEVITRLNNETVITEYLRSRNIKNIKFHFIDLPSKFKWLKSKDKGLYFYHLLWQIQAFFYSKKLLENNSFDYVWALTFGSIWMPTFMHLLPSKFIWGPLGGAEGVPNKMLSDLGFFFAIKERLRYALVKINKYNPFFIHASKRASILITRTTDTFDLLPTSCHQKAYIESETGFNASQEIPKNLTRLRDEHIQGSADNIQVTYTGRMVPIKNLEMAIYAFKNAYLQNNKFKFDLYGDGPSIGSLKQLVDDLDISHAVSFHGAIPRNDILKALTKADIFFFPSMKEGGPWSLFEAMAFAIPVVCLNTSGMSMVTSDETAIRVPPGKKSDVIKGFEDALIYLEKNQHLRNKMGNAAKQRLLEKFSWKAKCKNLLLKIS
jgi:glycosyltransferase involved in cell wall biosynthesis